MTDVDDMSVDELMTDVDDMSVDELTKHELN
jgi:hypothetical protein